MKMCAFALPFVFYSALGYSQEWYSDLDLALRQASEKNKPVLLYFSVPEACTTCEKLEEKVFSSTTWKEFAQQRYVLVRPSFESTASFESKAENLLIVEKYNKDGFFPFVVILDKNGKIMGKTGTYNNEHPEAYISMLESISR